MVGKTLYFMDELLLLMATVLFAEHILLIKHSSGYCRNIIILRR